jgi:transposase InsO family protein
MLFRILKANHMLILPKRRYHITTNSHHRFRKHKNLVENVVPERPEQIWVSDITYVGNRQNPMYLALVTDAYSKQIMGYDPRATKVSKSVKRIAATMTDKNLRRSLIKSYAEAERSALASKGARNKRGD